MTDRTPYTELQEAQLKADHDHDQAKMTNSVMDFFVHVSPVWPFGWINSQRICTFCVEENIWVKYLI